MAKEKKPQVDTEQKVQTKYEKKMEARRKQEEKDRREAKIWRICSIAVCVLIVAAIGVSIFASVWNKKTATKDTYLTIGSHSVTELEYDYYYSMLKNNYLSSYGSLFSYMGVDTTQDIEGQQYNDTMTYKDFFDQMTVEQISETKALVDDAAKNGFSYDVTEDYTEIVNGIVSGAETAGTSIKEYYQSMYGKYATEKNMEPFIKDGLLANEYYNHLIEQNAPETQEIKDYYGEHVRDYDRVDYHSFAIAAQTQEDASEEDTDKALMDAENKAKDMKEALESGKDFKELCIEYSTEENKTTYEDEETDASLREGAYYSGIPSVVADWLYEDGRSEGDTAVLEDTANNQYYVVKFISRYYDEADDTNISNTISSERAREYIDGLLVNYGVTDVKGELKYLTLEEEAVG